jgi:hypothetical protein
MMNYRKIIPSFLIKILFHLRQFFLWYKQGFLSNAPQLIKQNIFYKYGITNAPWVETGTFFGDTTDFLIKHFPKVYSIEPSKYLFDYVVKRFKNKKNVILYNHVSEKILPELLPNLNGDINFWLDGHYSSGITFKGDQKCPIKDELNQIGINLEKFNKVLILIDDVRCFMPNNEFKEYPSINDLVDWSRKNRFNWIIEHDIFIMFNFDYN